MHRQIDSVMKGQTKKRRQREGKSLSNYKTKMRSINISIKEGRMKCLAQ